jgi:hypothetical protein
MTVKHMKTKWEFVIQMLKEFVKLRTLARKPPVCLNTF